MSNSPREYIIGALPHDAISVRFEIATFHDGICKGFHQFTTDTRTALEDALAARGLKNVGEDFRDGGFINTIIQGSPQEALRISREVATDATRKLGSEVRFIASVQGFPVVVPNDDTPDTADEDQSASINPAPPRFI